MSTRFDVAARFPLLRSAGSQPSALEAAWTYAATLIVVAGAALRFDHYLSGHGLWLDEAYLAINILERPVAALLGPLEYNQQAPFGFLVLEKLAVALLGPGELALRALPFLCGVLVLVVFARVLRESDVDPMSRLVALTLVAFSEWMIRYSGEVKQYSLECLVGLLLYLAARPLFGSAYDAEWRRSAWRYASAGAVAMWFSLTAPVLLAGINAALLLDRVLRSGSRATYVRLAAVFGAQLAGLAIVYWIDLRHAAENGWLFEYWQRAEGLPGDSMGLASSVLWAFKRFAQTTRDLVLPLPAEIPAVLVIVALGWAMVARDTWAMAMLAPIMLLVSAIAAGVYPIAERLAVFIVPNIAIALTIGLRSCWSALRLLPISVPQAPGALGVAIPIILLAQLSVFVDGVPLTFREEIRPLLETLDRELDGGDVIYVYYGAQPAFRYYRHLDPERFDERRRAIRIVRGRPRDAEWGRFVNDFQQLEGSSRVWLLFSHGTNPASGLDEITASRRYLASRGRLLGSWPAHQAALYLFDLSRADGRKRGGAVEG